MPWKTAPLWRTLLLAVLLFAGLGSAFALDGWDEASVPAERDALAREVHFPAPKIGDRIRYVTVNPEGGERDVYLDATWQEPQVLPDQGGHRRPLDRILLDAWFAVAGQAPGSYRIDLSDASQHRIIGHLVEGPSSSTMRGCDLGDCTQGYDEESLERRLTYSPPGDTHRTPCGLFHSAQGHTLDLTEPHTLFFPCSGLPVDPDAVYTAVGAFESGGLEIIRFVAPGAAVSEVWMSPEIPYPVRIMVPQDPSATIILESFTGGDGPLATWDRAPVAVRPLEEAPRRIWGPKEPSGAPFLLSEAIQVAEDPQTSSVFQEPEAIEPDEDASAFRAYMDTHPDAVVVDAIYLYGDANGTRDEHTWRFVISDGEEALKVTVHRVFRPAWVNQAPHETPRQEPFYETAESVHVEAIEASKYLPPQRLPELLPTVDAMWGRWHDYVDPDSREAPNSWGFRFLDDDAGGSVVLLAGYTYRYEQVRNGGVFVNGTMIGTEDAPFGDVHRWLVFPGDGSVYFQEDVRVAYPPASRPDMESIHVTTETAPPVPQVLSIRVWNPPTPEVVAGAGAVALTLVLLHHFFPGFIRLFTRVRTDQALDHPIRSGLHETIRAEPGIHVRELARRIDVPRGTTEHHLRKLEQLDLVKSRVQGRHRAYFPVNTPRQAIAVAPVVRSAGARRILDALSDGSTASVSHLSRTTGLAVATVHHHVGRLEAAGLVRSARRPGVPAEIRLTDLGRDTGATAA